jgi:hypothetical protein
MVDMRNNLAKEVSDELETHFSSLVFNTLNTKKYKTSRSTKSWGFWRKIYANIIWSKSLSCACWRANQEG